MIFLTSRIKLLNIRRPFSFHLEICKSRSKKCSNLALFSIISIPAEIKFCWSRRPNKVKSIFKKGIVVFIFLVVVGAITGIFYLSLGEEEVIEEGVARITLQGPIQEGIAGFGAAMISPRDVENKLERASENPGIKALVIRLDTPGGAIAASQEIYEMFVDFDKPLIISMGDMAASGGYYIAAAADAIVAQPGTMTGSIGVISTFIDPEGLFEKLGLEREVITSGEHKDMFSRTFTEEEREKMQTFSDQAYDQFIDHIIAGRDMEEDEIRELATGEIFLGSQAYELGLIDELGGRLKALEVAGEMADIEDPEYFDLPEPSPWQRFMGTAVTLPETISRSLADPELVILEDIQEGLSPVVEYRVPGY